MKTYLSHINAVFAFLLLISCIANEVLAQTPQQVDQLIKHLESKDWKKREAAASSLIGLPQELRTDKVMKALVDELERERLRKSAEEGQAEYYSWLFDALAATRDDRVFPFFARIGSPTALIKFGDKGIPYILEKLSEKKNCNERTAFVHYLGEALKPKEKGYVAQGAIRESIKKALLKAMNESKHPDKNIEWFEYRARECANVRIYIVRALGYFAETGDTDILPIIESLAKDDPYFAVTKKTKQKGPYDVREEAQKILEKLKANEKKK